MHVPYSMDDSEPDLHCGMGGFGGNDYEYPPDDRDLGPPWGEPVNRSKPKPVVKPMYVFYNETELAQSEVYHRLLLRSLKHKDREIDALRKEILGMMNES